MFPLKEIKGIKLTQLIERIEKNVDYLPKKLYDKLDMYYVTERA